MLAADPTGLGAALSNVKADASCATGLEELAQRRDAHPAHSVPNRVLQQLGGVACQNHGGLVAGDGRAVRGQVEGDAASGRVFGSGRGHVEQLRHGA